MNDYYGEPPVEQPPEPLETSEAPPLEQQVSHRAWPVYLVTFCTAATMILLAGILMVSVVALLMVIGDVSLKEATENGNAWLQQHLEGSILAIGVGVAANVPLLAAVALVAVGLRRRDRSDIWRRLRLERVPLLDYLLVVFGLLALTTALDSVVVLANLQDYGALGSIRKAVLELSIGERILFALILGFGPGFAEELFFRGYVLTKLELAQGRIAALVASSILFGLFHMDPLHTPVAMVMGFYMGMAVLLTGSLWPAIVAHTINNLMAGLFPESTSETTLSVVYLVGGVLLSIVALMLLKRRYPNLHPAPEWIEK